MGKNDLSALDIKDEQILPAVAETSTNAIKRPKKSKQKKELDSETITLKIKASELAALKSKAGELVPLATYVKHYLRTKTDLLTP